MEQEDAYIPYEERTPRDWCRDINLKAEKFLKAQKTGMLIIPVVCLVMVVLALHFTSNANWWRGVGIFGFAEVCFIIIYIYTQKLIHEMHLAATPKQFLPIALRLKECVRYSNYLFHTFGLWITISALSGFKDFWWWDAASLIVAAGIAWLVPYGEKEVALRDDVDDLERSLRYS